MSSALGAMPSSRDRPEAPTLFDNFQSSEISIGTGGPQWFQFEAILRQMHPQVRMACISGAVPMIRITRLRL